MSPKCLSTTVLITSFFPSAANSAPEIKPQSLLQVWSFVQKPVQATMNDCLWPCLWQICLRRLWHQDPRSKWDQIQLTSSSMSGTPLISKELKNLKLVLIEKSHSCYSLMYLCTHSLPCLSLPAIHWPEVSPFHTKLWKRLGLPSLQIKAHCCLAQQDEQVFLGPTNTWKRISIWLQESSQETGWCLKIFKLRNWRYLIHKMQQTAHQLPLGEFESPVLLFHAVWCLIHRASAFSAGSCNWDVALGYAD